MFRFDLRAGEGRLVALLILVAFWLGLAYALVDTASTALFLSRIGAGALPQLYLAAAVVVPLVGAGFGWLSGRVPLGALATGALGGLTLSLAALWAATHTGAPVPAVVGLLLWSRVFSALLAVMLWSLAGRILHVRQTKRLYGVIASGDSLARILGYALVPLLIGRLGIVNLLVLAGAGLLAAIGAVLALVQDHRSALAAPQPQHPAPHAPRGALVGDAYVLQIVALVGLSSWAFSILDLSFARQVQLRFSSAEEVASFLGSFLLVLSLVRLLSRSLLSWPLLARFGVAVGLVAQPAMLCAGALAVLVGTQAELGPDLIFWLVAAVRLTDTSVNHVLTRPSLQLLFQALPRQQRGAVQSATESIVSPLALGAAGLTGLALGDAGLTLFMGLTLALSVAWLLVARQGGHAYLDALRRRLSRRGGLAAEVDLADPAAVELARRTLHSPHGGEVRYAIDLLRQRQPLLLEAARPDLLRHPDLDVRRTTLELITTKQISGDAAELAALIADLTDTGTRAAAIRALCVTVEEDGVPTVAPLLADPQPVVRRSAMVGLLRDGGVSGILAAGYHLAELLNSAEPAERALAAAIIGDVGLPSFVAPLRRLLADPAAEVRRAALLAAGQLGDERLLAEQVAALGERSTAAAAAASLMQMGRAALPVLTTAFPTLDAAARAHLARVLGAIGDAQALHMLRGVLASKEPEVRTAAYEALLRCQFRAAGAERRRMLLQLRAEAAHATRLLQSAALLGTLTETLAEALAVELERCHARVLMLLTVSTDAQAITVARRNLAQGTPEHRAYAVEIIDLLTPASLKSAIVPLFDDLAPPERLRRLQAQFPQPPLTPAAAAALLIGDAATPVSGWTRRCALHAAAVGGLAADPGAPDLSATAAIVERVAALRGVALFAATPGEILADLADRLVEVSLPADSLVFAQGDRGESLYVVLAGELRVMRGAQSLNRLGAGDVFGELAVLDPGPRTASVVTGSPTRLLRLDRADLDALLEERPEVARGLIRVVSRQLRARLADLAALRDQIAVARSGALLSGQAVERGASGGEVIQPPA